MMDIDDGGLLSFMNSFVLFYNQRNGTLFMKDGVSVYDLWKVFGITEEKVVEEIKEFYKSPEFERLPASSGALDLLSRISQQGNLAYAITARPAYTRYSTESNLRLNFGKYAPEVIFSKPYSSLLDPGKKFKTKAEICLEKQVGFVTEDSVEHANALGESGITVFLLTQPWNVNCTRIHPNVTRVESLSDVLKMKNLFTSE